MRTLLGNGIVLVRVKAGDLWPDADLHVQMTYAREQAGEPANAQVKRLEILGSCRRDGCMCFVFDALSKRSVCSKRTHKEMNQ